MMDELIGSAEELLVREGEFHPFAATLDEGGHVRRALPKSAGPMSSDLVGWLATSLKTQVAQSEELRAVCIVSLVSIQRPGTDVVVDAIRMALDHRRDYAAHVFFPYQLSSDAADAGREAAPPREVTFGEPFAARGVSFAFRGESYSS